MQCNDNSLILQYETKCSWLFAAATSALELGAGLALP